MRAEAVFAPMSVLAVWTGFVLLSTGFRRVRAVRGGRIDSEVFRLGESADVPADVAVSNRNLMNLLEMPLLFYIVSLAFYVTHLVTGRVIAMAWIYVGLRLVHSLIHLTYNRVTHRLVVFAASNFLLLALWIQFMVRVL